MLYTSQRTTRSIYAIHALSFRCPLMILHLSRMRRNVNRNVYNAGKCKRYTGRCDSAARAGAYTAGYGKSNHGSFESIVSRERWSRYPSEFTGGLYRPSAGCTAGRRDEERYGEGPWERLLGGYRWSWASTT